MKNVERIIYNKDEQEMIKSIFNKYLDVAIEELKAVKSDYTELLRTKMILTLKFKWEDANILDEPIPISLNDSKCRRYQSYKLSMELENFVKNHTEKQTELVFRSEKAKSKSTYTTSIKKGKRKIKSLHVEILDCLYKILKEKTIENNLSLEKSSVNSMYIDLLEKVENNKYIFYKVKTSNSGLTNIREAIGQILEYALIDEKIIAKKLIIIG